MATTMTMVVKTIVSDGDGDDDDGNDGDDDGNDGDDGEGKGGR
jgi:hypothetical protein